MNANTRVSLGQCGRYENGLHTAASVSGIYLKPDAHPAEKDSFLYKENSIVIA